MGWSEYHLAKSIGDALDVLTASKGQGRIIAGGTDLVIELRRGERSASVLVDISRIPELHQIEKQGSDLVMGALVTHAQAAASPLVRQYLPALAEACACIGSPQIRYIGTLVGNIVSAQPGADAALALHVFDTRVKVVGNAGERTLDLPELYEGLGLCCIDSCQELITHLVVDLPPASLCSAFERLSQRRTLILPVINTAVSFILDEKMQRIHKARVVVGPVSATPFRTREAEGFLEGAAPVANIFEEAGKMAAKESNPRPSLLRGSPTYRRGMVAVMVRRALVRALERRTNN